MDEAEEKRLLYRKQFIIGPRHAQSFSSWKKHEISESLIITSHPDLNVTQLFKEEESLTLIGYMIDPDRPNHDNDEILKRLLSEHSNELIRSTFDLCGNWILIYKRHDDIFLFHDCAGLRSVYYTDIDKTEDLWLASQPSLIALLIDLKEDQKAVDFIMTQKSKTHDYWWPGEKSPYSEIKALLPNHYLDLRKGKINRYWPDRKLLKLPKNEAIELISRRLKRIMLAAAQRFDMALAVSCGLDSRVMLAASKDIKDKVCIYNGKRPDMSIRHPDIVIPRRLTKKLNLEYHYIPQTTNIDEEFYNAYELNAPHPIRELRPGLQAELKYFKRKKVGVTGNVLEVARFAYKILNPEEYKPSGEYLATITRMKDQAFAIEAFKDWYNTTNEIYDLNIYDLFHWEQRSGRWLSNNCLVFSMAWDEVLFPYNCRNLLIDMLSVSEFDRMPKDYLFFKELINNMWPELLSEQINPRQKVGFIPRIYKKFKQITQ